MSDPSPVAVHGPSLLRLGVRDLDAATTRFETVLGGLALPAPPLAPRWALRPGLLVETRCVDEPGPRELIVRVPDLSAVVQVAEVQGLAVAVDGDTLRVTDARVASGELVCTSRPGPAAPTAHTPGAAAVRRTDHVALVVSDLRRALTLLQAAGGVPVLGGDGEVGARAVLLRFDLVKIELLAPTGPGPTQDFLDRRGGRAGLHHLTVVVDDVAAADAALRQLGLTTVGLDTQRRATWHEAFLPPREHDRFLIQLAWTDQDHRTPLTSEQLRDVLHGCYDVTSYTFERKQEAQP
jgi:methylmalonyl-CoA/ethylmalonyl-CoA epimerase